MSDDLTWDRLRTEHLPVWAELVNHLAQVDGTGEFYSAEDLAESLAATGHTPETDTWSVWAGDRLVGFGRVLIARSLDEDGRVRAHLEGGVHARHRGRGIGTALMDRLEARAAELGAQRHPGREVYCRASGGLEGADVRRLLTGRGYRIVRYFSQMTRPLPGDPLDLPRVEATLREPVLADEAELLAVHNAAFADHWGAVPQTPEGWHDHWSRSTRWPVSTLAVDDAGAILSYCLVGQWVDREAYVVLVGTAPHARGRGLAAACLGRTIGLCAGGGDYDVIELDVDSDSPTGATRLYERLGFTVAHTSAAMSRDLPGP